MHEKKSRKKAKKKKRSPTATEGFCDSRSALALGELPAPGVGGGQGNWPPAQPGIASNPAKLQCCRELREEESWTTDSLTRQTKIMVHKNYGRKYCSKELVKIIL